MKLTRKQNLFCKEYLVDLNGAAAAFRAGYSKSSAKVIAAENLTKPYLQAKIQELMDERSKRVEISSDDVLWELKNIALNDINDYVTYSDSGVEFKELSEIGNRSAISSIEITQQGTLKVRFYDKIRALELLGKHLRLFADRVEVEVSKVGTITKEHTEGINHFLAQQGVSAIRNIGEIKELPGLEDTDNIRKFPLSKTG